MSDLKALVADIVGSYLTHNKLAPDQVPALIGDTYAALVGAVDGKPADAGAVDTRKPTVAQIRKSVTDDQITCLICGQGFKSMKRHLAAAHGMSPIEYRTALGLKSDYPTVAPAYAQHRSVYAKSIGLGRGRKGGNPAPVTPAPAAAPAPAETPKAAASKAAKPPQTPKAAKPAPKAPARAKRTAATAADRPPIKPAVAARPPGAIDPASDSFK